jgi:RecA/RadA recombinase
MGIMAKEKPAVTSNSAKIEALFKKYPYLKDPTIPPLRGLSTGSLMFDMILGGEGVPIGEVTQFFGPSTSGKTTMTLLMALQAVNDGKRVLHINTEGRTYGARLYELGFLVEIDDNGVETFNHFDENGLPLITMVTKSLDEAGNGTWMAGEDVYQLLCDAIESRFYDLVIVDSVAMATASNIRNQEMQKIGQIGQQAKLNKLMMLKVKACLTDNPKCTVVFTNQVYDNIGGFSPTGGTPQIASGGNQLKFGSVIAIKTSVTQPLKPEDKLGKGIMFKVAFSKNNALAKEYGPFEIPLNETEDGFWLYNTAYEVMYIAKQKGNIFITKEGESWKGGNSIPFVMFEDEKVELPRGLDNQVAWLWEHENVLDSLVARIKKKDVK